VKNAPERFDEGRNRGLYGRTDSQSIHRRHRDKLREAARKSRDAMLAIKLALVRIISPAVFTQNFAPPADAIQALIDNDPISRS
jgi:hypothetical protein